MSGADYIRAFALFAHNVNRWDLEEIGIMPTGSAGDEKWKRFNQNLTGFILKLEGDQLEAFAALANRFINPMPELAQAAE